MMQCWDLDGDGQYEYCKMVSFNIDSSQNAKTPTIFDAYSGRYFDVENRYGT